MIVRESKKFLEKHVILFSLLSALIVAVFVLEKVSDETASISLYNRLVRKFYVQPKSAIRRNLSSRTVPHLNIQIKFKHAKKLAEDRDRALKRGGIILKKDKNFVPATIEYLGKVVPVEVRLKGDTLAHIKGDKWSLRVRVKSDNSILGMRVLSLHSPDARSGIKDWYFSRVLEKVGVLALRIKIVNVSINGKEKGVYVVEDGFSKEFLEAQGRRESFIVKYSEHAYWEFRQHHSGFRYSGVSVPELIPVLSQVPPPPGVFNLNKASRHNEDLAAQKIRVLSLLSHASTRKSVPASHIFDVDLTAKFLALSELWGAKHGLHWSNQRFYFNPITNLLEPIGFDSESASTNQLMAFLQNSTTIPFPSYLLKDLEIFRKFISYCLEYSSPSFLKDLRKEFLDGELFVSDLLKADYVYNASMDWNVLKELQRKTRKYLSPPVHLYAYARVEKDGLYIDLMNITNLPIVIDSIRFGSKGQKVGSKRVMNYSVNPYFPLAKELILPGLLLRNKVTTLKLPIKYSSEYKKNKYYVVVKSHVIETENKQEAKSFSYRPSQLVQEGDFSRGIPIPPSEEAFLKNNPQIKKTDERTYHFRKGSYRIDRLVATPKLSTLVINEGTRLKFSRRAGLVVHGSLLILGNEKNKVWLEPVEKQWDGIVVYKSERKSLIRHAHIINATSPNREGWVLTGAVTFYQSTVHIADSLFKGSQSEDMLNLFQSSFLIEDSRFEDCSSDAIDFDFSKGAILRTSFKNVKGDGIDFSGSTASITGVEFSRIGDKAVSAGEKSKIVLKQITIVGAKMGVVSKDDSHISVENGNISHTSYGLAAFQKKSEFDGGTIVGDHITFNKNNRDIVIQKGSRGSIDNKPVKEEPLDIRKLYGEKS